MAHYFCNCKTKTEAKKLHRDLLRANHPDAHTEEKEKYEEITKEINAEYDKIIDILPDVAADQGSNSTTEETEEQTEEYTEAVKAMLNRIHLEGVTVEVVGSWIWLSGNTYPVKDQIKDLGFKWSKSRKKWYWHEAEENEQRHRGSSKTFDEIRFTYGSAFYQTTAQPKLANC